MNYSLQTVTFWNLMSLLIWRGLYAAEYFKEITATPRTFKNSCPCYLWRGIYIAESFRCFRVHIGEKIFSDRVLFKFRVLG